MSHLRQQLLHLWLAGSDVDRDVLAWSFQDSTDGEGPVVPDETPPYTTGLDAMRDGWMLIQATPPHRTDPDPHAPAGYLDHEFVFERRIELPRPR